MKYGPSNVQLVNAGSENGSKSSGNKPRHNPPARFITCTELSLGTQMQIESIICVCIAIERDTVVSTLSNMGYNKEGL